MAHDAHMIPRNVASHHDDDRHVAYHYVVYVAYFTISGNTKFVHTASKNMIDFRRKMIDKEKSAISSIQDAKTQKNA